MLKFKKQECLQFYFIHQDSFFHLVINNLKNQNTGSGKEMI